MSRDADRSESAELIKRVGHAPEQFGLGRKERPRGHLLCSTCGEWKLPEEFMTHPGVSYDCASCRGGER